MFGKILAARRAAPVAHALRGLQILFAADKGDDTKDQNHEEEKNGDVRPGNFWHEHSVVSCPSACRTLQGGYPVLELLPPP